MPHTVPHSSQKRCSSANCYKPIWMQRAQWQPVDLWLGTLLFGWYGYWLLRKRIGNSCIFLLRGSENSGLTENAGQEEYNSIAEPELYSHPEKSLNGFRF